MSGGINKEVERMDEGAEGQSFCSSFRFILSECISPKLIHKFSLGCELHVQLFGVRRHTRCEDSQLALWARAGFNDCVCIDKTTKTTYYLIRTAIVKRLIWHVGETQCLIFFLD